MSLAMRCAKHQDVLSYSGWTRTDKRVLYRTYDVTKLLNASGGGDIFVGLGCGYRHTGSRDGLVRAVVCVCVRFCARACGVASCVDPVSILLRLTVASGGR